MPLDGLAAAYAQITLARLLHRLHDPNVIELPDLNRLRGLQPDSTEAAELCYALELCARRLLRQGQLTQALNAFNAVRDLGGSNPLLSERLGFIFFERGRNR